MSSDQESAGQENKDKNSSSKDGLITRIFDTPAYMRLFFAQFVTSLGDWLGLIAISIVATQIGAGSPETAVAFVLGARLIPGFFFSQLAGVVADRLNRRRLMIICDMARAAVLLYLPFVDTVWQLIIVSLLLEVFTLLWIPAKEALLPNIISKQRLAQANSFSLVATYGTYPLASVLLLGFAALGKVLEEVSPLGFLRIDDSSIAFYVDSLTFLASAYFLFSMAKFVKAEPPKKPAGHIGWKRVTEYLKEALSELTQGMKFIAVNPVVRSVNIGTATALFGGGMLIPLGAVFATDVLNAGASGFAGMQVALGSGAGAGIVLLLLLKRHKDISDENLFIWSLIGAGVSLIAAAAANFLAGTLVCIGILGIFAGAIYVSGFTMLHDKVSDQLRGKVFSSFYALIRLCILLSLVVGPFLSSLIGRIVNAVYQDEIIIGEFSYGIPGVRITLWLAAVVMILAGIISRKGLKKE